MDYTSLELTHTLKDLIVDRVYACYIRYNENQSKAAKSLGISRISLKKYLRLHPKYFPKPRKSKEKNKHG